MINKIVGISKIFEMRTALVESKYHAGLREKFPVKCVELVAFSCTNRGSRKRCMRAQQIEFNVLHYYFNVAICRVPAVKSEFAVICIFRVTIFRVNQISFSDLNDF